MAANKRKGRFAGPASMHVKKSTAGTSNEISLSVLDELKSRADDAWGEGDPKVKLGDLSLFTVKPRSPRAGVPPESRPCAPAPSQGASARHRRAASRLQRARERALVDPEREIRRRKKNRRLRRAAAVALSVCACCLLAGSGALWLANEYECEQERLATLDRAFDEMEKADALILSMDDAVMADASELSFDDMDAVRSGIDDADMHLNAACAFAEDAASSLKDETAAEAAGRVGVSADARRRMMQYAAALLTADREAKAAVDAAQECWSLVLEADGHMKRAASLVADTTTENIDASQESTDEAAALLSQAQGRLDDALRECPSADFSALSAYIAKRIEQNEYASSSNRAIRVQDKATAESWNDRYNRADAEAIELAAALPAKPAQPVLDALDAQTAETRSLYADARKRAAESDAFIRDYLGQSGS